MYINQFWCGVIATVIAEIVATIGLIMWVTRDTKNNKNQDKTNKK